VTDAIGPLVKLVHIQAVSCLPFPVRECGDGEDDRIKITDR
jgi:hypothetical protein